MVRCVKTCHKRTVIIPVTVDRPGDKSKNRRQCRLPDSVQKQAFRGG